MPTPNDFEPVYPITFSLDFGPNAADNMATMLAGQEVVEVFAEQYSSSFCGGSGHLANKTMTLYFTDLRAAEEAKTDWYMARARVLAENARHKFGIDPDDIPL